jgi:RNA polymerase sigma factor for flagellar operon FliA
MYETVATATAATASTTTGPRVDVDRLVQDSLPLVRSVVASMAAHYPRHCDRDELVAAGTFGLVEAARRFDPSKGVPFDRWAVLRIRGAVVDAVRALDFAPRALRSSARDLTAVRDTLESELGRTPTSDEVADRMGLPLAELVQLEGRLHRSTVLSLDAPTRDAEGDTTLAAIVLDPGADPLEQLERRERDSYVTDALQTLPDRLREVLVGYFLEGRTSGELAEQLGVTESRVSQMRTEALRLVREGLAAQYGEATTAQTGRAAAKQAAYNASLSARSSYTSRLAAVPRARSAGRIAG